MNLLAGKVKGDGAWMFRFVNWVFKVLKYIVFYFLTFNFINIRGVFRHFTSIKLRKLTKVSVRTIDINSCQTTSTNGFNFSKLRTIIKYH